MMKNCYFLGNYSKAYGTLRVLTKLLTEINFLVRNQNRSSSYINGTTPISHRITPALKL